jgi:hypothetical protein
MKKIDERNGPEFLRRRPSPCELFKNPPHPMAVSDTAFLEQTRA